MMLQPALLMLTLPLSVRAKTHLAQASFNLRKFESNSPELYCQIQENERELCKELHKDQWSSSTHSSDLTQESPLRQVIGINWDGFNDQLLFDIGDVTQQMKETCPTKRNAVSLATQFYDPLGSISPITVNCSRSCARKN